MLVLSRRITFNMRTSEWLYQLAESEEPLIAAARFAVSLADSHLKTVVSGLPAMSAEPLEPVFELVRILDHIKLEGVLYDRDVAFSESVSEDGVMQSGKGRYIKH